MFVLAFALHPKYSKTALKIIKLSEKHVGTWRDGHPLSARRLANAALFYYQKHELWLAPEDNPSAREREEKDFHLHMLLYLSGKTVLDNVEDYDAVRWPDPCDWYNLFHDAFGLMLVNFALFLLDCPVQSASCERLFKDFARFLSKHRSRLLKEKLMMSAMIKRDLKHKYPEDSQA